MPAVVLRIPVEYHLTVGYLRRVLVDLFDQVAAMEPLRPTMREREIMAQQIDAALDWVRPVAVEILVETPLEKMLCGEFEIREENFGRVIIS